MKLLYTNDNISYSVNTILEFTNDTQTRYWSDCIFNFYPDIDKENFNTLNKDEKMNFLTQYFTEFKDKNNLLFSEKLDTYNEHWLENSEQVINALEDAFQIKLTNLFNDMVGIISFCPICPRYISERRFDVFYQNSKYGALANTLHEIIHFVWFHVWNEKFKDNPSEYETPHLKWILSEMVVDCIMQDSRLKTLHPHFDKGCVYSYFYTLRIDGRNILETLNQMYTTMDIGKFMEESYAYCILHEKTIRNHIEKNEQ